MKVNDVLRCSFHSWYPQFKKFTTESIILPLPPGFIEYLLADGIVLPERGESNEPAPRRISESSSDNEDDWEDSDTTTAEAPKFEEFDQKIKQSIKELGGKVFPKLNWSSPRDAAFIKWGNSCCCCDVSDIYLLLKSSQLITHDLTAAFDLCDDHLEEGTPNADSKITPMAEIPYYLVLRKWIEIYPSTEYRCFVKDNQLVGLSQRDHCTMYENIKAEKDDIVEDILSYFRKNIQSKFPCCNYVFDVYREKIVYLVDFNPFGRVTDSLLFEWEELEKEEFCAEKAVPEFRFVDTFGFQPKFLSEYSIPKDIIDISNGTDSFKLCDLLQLQMKNELSSSSEDES